MAGPDRIARHNQLRNVFYHTLVAAGMQADRENASPGLGPAAATRVLTW